MRRWRKLHSALIVIALWCVAFGSCYRLLTPPDLGARLTVSPAYSVNTALAHLKHIAAEPHPLGSKAHQRVAGYLLEQLNHLGYQADVQETIAVSPRDDTDRSGREQVLKVAWVKNIAVRIPGSDSRGAVLIAGHYDSVDSSFGAADNGAAVASMLEVLRLLKNSPPPKNDMIFLFSDAEELGLLGSRAFVEQHPWAKDGMLALNFEARGTGGVLLMFETSEQNGGVVEHYAQSAYHPVASSLMYSFYKKLLHNDTDFTVFKETGMAGLNFAFIEGGTAYHTRLDNLERLDTHTLALQGQNMLQLARHFADADLQQIRQQADRGYFNLPFGGLFRFPLSSNAPLLISTGVLLAFVLLFGIGAHRKMISARQCLRQTVLFVLFSGLIVGSDYALYALIRQNEKMFQWSPEPYHASLYFLAFCAFTMGLFALFCLKPGPWIRLRELSTGVLLIWLATGIYLAVEFPGGVFFTVVPAISMIPAWSCWVLGSRTAPYYAPVIALCSAFALTIIAPTLYLAHHALGFHAAWLLMIFVVLTMGLLAPALEILYQALRWTMAGFLLSVAALSLVLAHIQSDFSRDNPKPNSIVYALDMPNHAARWLSYDPEPDDWTRQFLGATPTVSGTGIFSRLAPGLPLLERQAPPSDLAAPDVRLVARFRTHDKTYVKVRINSKRHAPYLRVGFEGMADILLAYADDRLIYKKNRSAAPLFSIDLHGLPETGTMLTFVLPEHVTLRQLEIIEVRADLAEIWQPDGRPRPENTMPKRSSSALPVDAVILRQVYPL